MAGRGTDIFSIIVSITGLVKNALAYKKVNQSARTDIMWTASLLEEHAHNVFVVMQEAWVARDMAGVKEWVTDEFYNRYTAHFEMNKADSIHNLVEDVEVLSVTILDTEDYKDDSRDTYSALIKGTMRDYTISEITGKVIRNVGRQLSEFGDIYFFTRSSDNKWLLREIDTEADGLDMAVTRNYRET
jgi:predicted lipid-binding transport protein (Tim44 family)